MGGRFSVHVLKSKLEVAVKRMQGQMNKKTNAIKVQRREIAKLLSEKKDESARIRVEALMHEIHLVEVMEIISLMCQLLSARTSLLASDKYMPDDLIEAGASIIFCAKRLEIPELVEITKQFAYRYTEEWVKQHINNQAGKVNSKIIDKLSIKPPEFKVVIDYLKEIAEQYNVSWEPNMVEDASDKPDNPNVMGAIAPINYNEAKAEEKDDTVFRPGTLNIMIHEARKLYATQLLGTMDPYCVVSYSGQPSLQFRTRVMKNAGLSCVFHEEYFPYAVKDATHRIRIEVFNKNMMIDDFVGRAFFDVDFLAKNPQKAFYRIGRGDYDKVDAGEICISTQFMPYTKADQEEAIQPHAYVPPPVTPTEYGRPIASSAGSSPAPTPQPMQPSPASPHYPADYSGLHAPVAAPYYPGAGAPPLPSGPPPPMGYHPAMPAPIYYPPQPHPGYPYAPDPHAMAFPHVPAMAPGYPAHTPIQPPAYDESQPGSPMPTPSESPHDLSFPSVPSNHLGRAGSQEQEKPSGPPDIDELEARFRALQK